MTFGKGDHQPHRKQAAPPKARGQQTKELRKQARAQVQQAIENNKSEPRDKDNKDNEDVAHVKACGFFMFLYKLIYVYKIVCAQLLNIYFIEYI
jgi:hypothetical protein